LPGRRPKAYLVAVSFVLETTASPATTLSRGSTRDPRIRIPMISSLRAAALVLTVFASAEPAFAQAYCNVVCPSAVPCASSFGRTHITSVQIGSINNASGCVGSAYQDFSSSVAPATLVAAKAYAINVVLNQFYGNFFVAAWVDWNSDFVFDDGEVYDLGLGAWTFNGTAQFSGTIAVPSGAPTPSTVRMRVAAGFGGVSFVRPPACGCYDFIDREDYSLSLVAAAAPFTMALVSPAGPGSIGLSLTGGTSGSLYFAPLTLIPGAYPNGWFYGLDPLYSDLLVFAAFGPPFVGYLDANGAYSWPPAGQTALLPSGLTLYGVAADRFWTSTPGATAPITYVVP
jgi:hypothetical protein